MNERWHDVHDTKTVREQGLVGVVVEGREIALYALEDTIYASENRCTHGDARLTDGFLLDDEIECPLHQGRFCVRTGAPMCAPLTAPLRMYAVRLESARVWVSLDAGDFAAPLCASASEEGR